MRLRDGESNLLAGLIRQEDREIVNSLPGISQIPDSALVLRDDEHDDRLQRHHHDRHAAHHSLA
jgi:hypothetical protein